MNSDTPSDLTVSSESSRSIRQSIPWIWLGATGVALFFSAQMKVASATAGHPQSWGQVLYWAFGDWYEWAALAPLIFWLGSRFHFSAQEWRRSLCIHAAGGLVFSIIHAGMCAGAYVLQKAWENSPGDFLGAWRGLLSTRLHFNLAVYALLVAGWQAWTLHREKRARESEAQRLREELVRVQLQALRMQLNPHFLFNTLNTVSALMLKDIEAANKMISRLGGLLRLALDSSNQQEISLQKELEFLGHYLEIEKIRFGERLRLKLDVQPAVLDAAVPNMILQPLIENAIRHAVEPHQEKGEIELRCIRSNGNLVMEIADNGPGSDLSPKNFPLEKQETRERIGLNNVQQRLQKLYGPRHQFAFGKNDRGGTTVKLHLPFQPISSADPVI